MRLITTAIGGVAAMLLAGAAPASAQDTIKIGLIMTLSGQFADAGIQMQNGVKTYMKEHGETVGGKKIESSQGLRRHGAGRGQTARAGADRA